MKKHFLIAGLCIALVVFQSQWLSGQQSGQQQKPQQKDESSNLKILPKHISEEEIHRIMREYSKALGVRCGHCHAASKTDPKRLDLASDEKPEKDIARGMMKMTDKINEKFIDKIGKAANEHFEHITCVSCHMGHLKPLIFADSLKKEVVVKKDSLIKN